MNLRTTRQISSRSLVLYCTPARHNSSSPPVGSFQLPKIADGASLASVEEAPVLLFPLLAQTESRRRCVPH